MPKEKFKNAQVKKNDEFYTQYVDIQKEQYMKSKHKMQR